MFPRSPLMGPSSLSPSRSALFLSCSPSPSPRSVYWPPLVFYSLSQFWTLLPNIYNKNLPLNRTRTSAQSCPRFRPEPLHPNTQRTHKHQERTNVFAVGGVEMGTRENSRMPLTMAKHTRVQPAPPNCGGFLLPIASGSDWMVTL